MTTSQKTFRYGYVIAALIALGYFSSQYSVSTLSPLSLRLIQEFSMTTAQYSRLTAANQIPAIFGLAIFAGTLVDRFGGKKIVGFGLTLGAIGLVSRIFVTSYSALYVCQLCAGMGVILGGAVGAKLCAGWLPANKMPIYVGFFLVGSNLASSFGTATGAMFPTTKIAFTVTAIFAVVTALLWWILYKENPVAQNDSKIKTEKQNVFDFFKVAAKNKYVWLCAFSLFFELAGWLIVSPFLPAAFKEIQGLTAVQAGLYSSIINFTCLGGCFFMPALCIKIAKKTSLKVPLLITGIMLVIPILFIWRLPVGVWTFLFSASMGLGLAAFVSIVMGIPVMLDGIGEEYGGSAGGILAIMQRLGAVLVPGYIVVPLVGRNYPVLFGVAFAMMTIMVILPLLIPKSQLDKDRGKSGEIDQKI